MTFVSAGLNNCDNVINYSDKKSIFAKVAITLYYAY